MTGCCLKSWVRLITPRKAAQMAELRLGIRAELECGSDHERGASLPKVVTR